MRAIPHVLFLFYIFHAGTVKGKEHKKNKPLAEQNRAQQPAQSPEKTSPWTEDPTATPMHSGDSVASLLSPIL